MITWQNITTGQYQDLYTLIGSELDPLEKEVQCIAMLANMTILQVEALPLDKYKALRRSTMWAFEQPPQGKLITRFGKYKLIRDVRDLDTGRYISIQTFLQMDLIANLHNLTACIIKPRWGKYDGAKHQQYADDCRNAPFLAVYQTMVFFCNLSNDSMKALEPFLADELKGSKHLTKDQIADSLLILKNTLAGLPTLKG